MTNIKGSQLRIGMIADVYRTGYNGVANYVGLAAHALRDLGQHVSIFAFEKSGVTEPEEDVYFSPGFLTSANYPVGFRLTPRAAAALETMDVVHVHQPFLSGMMGIMHCKKRRIPLVFTAHSLYDHYANHYAPPMISGLSARLIHEYMRFFLRRVDAVIANSADVETAVQSWATGVPICRIANGIDGHLFENSPEIRQAARKRLGLPEDAFIFLYSGRIAPEKNVEFLVDAFKVCTHRLEKGFFVIVGGGPQLQQIKRLVNEKGLSSRTLLTGNVPYEKIPDYTRSANAAVTASRMETNSLSLIEAYMAGLPVIAFGSPGIRNMLQDRVAGFLCPNDAIAFSDRMVELGQDPSLWNFLSKNACAAGASFSITAAAKKLLETYHWVIGTYAG
jgi:1,2-diacylglycerol 3-alpha-glucosyltransferase